MVQVAWDTSALKVQSDSGGLGKTCIECCSTIEYSETDCEYCTEGKTPLHLTVTTSGITDCTGVCCYYSSVWSVKYRESTLNTENYPPNGTWQLTQDGTNPCLWHCTKANYMGYDTWTNGSCSGSPGHSYETTYPLTILVEKTSSTQMTVLVTCDQGVGTKRHWFYKTGVTVDTGMCANQENIANVYTSCSNQCWPSLGNPQTLGYGGTMDVIEGP